MAPVTSARLCEGRIDRAGKGRYGAIFWVKKKDVARAARLVGAR